MSDYTELKRLAAAAKNDCGDYVALNDYGMAVPPAVVLELIAELERNQRMLLAACMDMGAIGNALNADMNSNGEELLSLVVDLKADLAKEKTISKGWHENWNSAIAERDQLKAENEHARMRIKELDLLFGRYLLGMRSSVIEWQNGQGADAAMQWIWNGLAGPGELPPEDETQAQAYFDREIVAVDAGMEEVALFFDARRVAQQATP